MASSSRLPGDTATTASRKSVATRVRASLGLAMMSQSAKPPTAMKASSLTTDSKAMATTMPRWCSVASRLRVPNSMLNSASNRATPRASSAVLPVGPAGTELAISRSSPVTMALSCSTR